MSTSTYRKIQNISLWIIYIFKHILRDSYLGLLVFGVHFVLVSMFKDFKIHYHYQWIVDLLSKTDQVKINFIFWRTRIFKLINKVTYSQGLSYLRCQELTPQSTGKIDLTTFLKIFSWRWIDKRNGCVNSYLRILLGATNERNVNYITVQEEKVETVQGYEKSTLGDIIIRGEANLEIQIWICQYF